ncbi:Radial spoke head protein 9 [Cladochytrium tenue]|nr:Radial spoke head protein 9 [Cladochytrium tenue]
MICLSIPATVLKPTNNYLSPLPVQSPTTKGLSPVDLPQLASYLHLREGFDINARSVADRGGAALFDESIDIFEAVSHDEPKGCWSLQVLDRSASSRVAVLRSLVWPGYTFFHAAGAGRTARFASMYYGWGVKNRNIGLML